jgi:hypothetical protein
MSNKMKRLKTICTRLPREEGAGQDEGLHFDSNCIAPDFSLFHTSQTEIVRMENEMIVSCSPTLTSVFTRNRV